MKTGVITGVSRGMGEKIAEKFLSEGWYVIGTSTSGKSPVKHENFEVHKLNFLEPSTVYSFVQSVKKSGKTIDALINNAGIYLEGEDKYPLEQEPLRTTLEVNLIGPILLTQKLLPLFNEGGSIVNMSSQNGSLTDTNGDDMPSYHISKTAINMFTRTLAVYLQSKNIAVSSMDPGWVRTDMGGPDAPRDPKEPAEEMYKLATSKGNSGYFWHRGKKRSW